MKLISLKANQPSFHPVIFNDGISIVVGKQVAPHNENDGNTYNGVGKSLILHLIHFCFGANKIDSFSHQLSGWEFTLNFEHNGERFYATRSTKEQNKINFCGEILNPKAMRQRMFELCFEINNPPRYMTWTTLFSRFVRRFRSCYTSFDSYIPKESDYSKILNNCYLLGIDIDLIVSKKELREKQNAASTTEKAIKNDPLFRQYYLGKNDAEIDEVDLQYRIRQLEEQLSDFKVSKNYHELEREADEKSYKKKILENRRTLVNNYIKNIENAISDTVQIKEEKLIEIYKAANVEIPDMVKRNLDEVLEFHSSLLSSRNNRLKNELRKHNNELDSIDEEIKQIGLKMDELLGFLNSHGALEEYTALTKQLSSMQNELNHIQEYQKILKSYNDTILNIKSDFIEQDRETSEYLECKSEYFAKLRSIFWNYAKKFYPKKRSGLVIKNNSGENMLRYSLDARIEDDSSDGVNEVRIFCFDLLMLSCKQSNIDFIAHDSRLFANMDPRQRETLFRIIYDTCQKENLQYFCSINEDALLSFKPLMTEKEYKEIIQDNVILELNDDSPESKLLGIQIDIDLEDKSKSNDDLN